MAAIAHQAAGQGELTSSIDRGQRIAGSQRHELFGATDVESTVADQDSTHALLRQSCKGCFEFAIVSSIHNNKLQTQRARRRLQVWDDGLDKSRGRVRENAEPGGIGDQLAEQLELFRSQFGG